VSDGIAAEGAGWARRLDRVRWLGPGLVVAATAVGASHLVLAPTAGASFGYALLWVIPFAHLFKYPAFEFAPRYAVATGTSLLDGYARVPGPRGWALWVFLLGTFVQGVTVLAGVLGVAAAVAHAAIPGLPLWAWSVALGVLVGMLLASGGFDGLSALSKFMLLGLAAMTAVAFLATPPAAGDWVRLAVPSAPEGSLVLLAAILGWMPTGIDVSVWHSMWALEREGAWRERAEGSGREGALRVGLTDLRTGYGLSLVLGVMFVALGAEVLRPAGRVPEGADVAVTLARLYTDVLGEWVLPLFLAAAFFGMFSTTYGVMDGFPRAFAETWTRIRPGGGDRRRGRLYWGFLAGTFLLAIAESVLLPDPVVLVTVAAVASFLLSPVTFALNYWCATRHLEPRHRPGAGLRGWAIAGILFSAGAAALFLWVEFLR
jgi:Mn2+/Fe2+ NRAMP family transporter